MVIIVMGILMTNLIDNDNDPNGNIYLLYLLLYILYVLYYYLSSKFILYIDLWEKILFLINNLSEDNIFILKHNNFNQ